MEVKRGPLQGVTNIIRFNWHFYALAILFSAILFLAMDYAGQSLRLLLRIISLATVATTAISLLVSYYIYDLSEIYKLTWMDKLLSAAPKSIANVNAGFDETSILLLQKFPNSKLAVFDFFDQRQHSEISLKRARQAYAPFPNTILVRTNHILADENSFDLVLVNLAAHEIREHQERVLFFAELRRILTPAGQIIVVEHLQDVANFLAYNIGFCHFHRPAVWRQTFAQANLQLAQELKITPFISAFVLKKNGITS